MRITRTWIGYVIALLVMSAGQLDAQAVREPSPETPPVEVGGRPLVDLLRELSSGAAVDLRVDPAVADRSVAVDLDGLEMELALKQVLLASGVDFVMAWKAGRLQVLAGDLNAAIEVASRVDSGTAVPGTQRLRPTPEATSESAPSQPVREATGEAPLPPVPEVSGAAAAQDGVAGAGTVNGEQLTALLATPPTAPVAALRDPWVIELPFTDANGQPIRIQRPAGTPTAVMLPFTGDTGQPVMQPLSPRPAGVFDLPFPDENGQPIRLIPMAPTTAPRRPPGDR